MAVARVIVGDRHRKDLGDIEGLAENIKTNGLLHPIVVTPEGNLVAGRRRLAAIEMLTWQEVPITVLDVPSTLECEHAENALRKDFTISECVSIAEALKAKMPERRGNQNTDNSPGLKGHETRDLLAKRVGFATGKAYERAKRVVEHGIPKLVQAMDVGDIKVSAAALVAGQPIAKQEAAAAEGVKGLREVAKALRKAKSNKPAGTSRKPDDGLDTGEHVSQDEGGHEDVRVSVESMDDAVRRGLTSAQTCYDNAESACAFLRHLVEREQVGLDDKRLDETFAWLRATHSLIGKLLDQKSSQKA